jgi:hypothetical protein
MSEKAMQQARESFRKGNQNQKWTVMRELVLGPGLERRMFCTAFIRDLTGCSPKYLALHNEIQREAEGAKVEMPPHAGTGHTPANKTDEATEKVMEHDFFLYTIDNPTSSEIRYWGTDEEKDQASFLRTVNTHLLKKGLVPLPDTTGKDVLHRLMRKHGVKHVESAHSGHCVCKVPTSRYHFTEAACADMQSAACEDEGRHGEAGAHRVRRARRRVESAAANVPQTGARGPARTHRARQTSAGTGRCLR